MANNAKKKTLKKFSSLGLNKNLLRAIRVVGYKAPTRIQAKTVPIVLAGKDVVVNSRTGSGKTASFLFPLLQMLEKHSDSEGARALVLAPTRELAFQVHSDLKKLGKYTDFHACLVVGGENLAEQFYSLNNRPDIIVATPGRIYQILNETSFKLAGLKYLVFDEADRLFEMGFATQINFILSKIPLKRQLMLYSATVPKAISEFSKAALKSPVVVRLDDEMALNSKLTNVFLKLREDEKLPTLLSLLRSDKSPIPSNEQSIVFCSTRHRAELVNRVLLSADVVSAACYGQMDQAARKAVLADFREKRTRVLVVTDLAARGLDIPDLESVVNFCFPAQPKLYVHRVGRVARNGRSGKAFSLVVPDELPYLIETATHLGENLKVAKKNFALAGDENFCVGEIPPSFHLRFMEFEGKLIERDSDAKKMKRAADSGERLYIKTRPAASKDSVRRSKTIFEGEIDYHPIFDSKLYSIKETKEFKLAISKYRPRATIFEIGEKKSAKEIMQLKRRKISAVKAKFTEKDIISHDLEKGKDRDNEILSNQQNTSINAHKEPITSLERLLNKGGKNRFLATKGKTEKRQKKEKTSRNISKKAKEKEFNDFRDPKHFINLVSNKSEIAKFRCELQAEEKNNEENSDEEIRKMNEGVGSIEFEIAPDELSSLNRKQYKKWDSGKRKFTLVTEVDGKVVKEANKLFKATDKPSGMQKIWNRTKSKRIKSSRIDRWGGCRTNRYVSRLEFEESDQEPPLSKKAKQKRKRLISRKLKKRAAGKRGDQNKNGKKCANLGKNNREKGPKASKRACGAKRVPK